MARILVVDDHPQIVRLVQRELEAEEHEVYTAADGEEALQQIQQAHPDLVVLDVRMPKKDGFAVLRELKADPATQATIVILLTSMEDDAEITRGLQAGADWYVPKPFRPGELAMLARRFLGSVSAPGSPLQPILAR
jgi:DNA-binding response OmpR family regulator